MSNRFHLALTHVLITIVAACQVADERSEPRWVMIESSGDDASSESGAPAPEPAPEPADGDCPDGTTEKAVGCGFVLAKLSGGPWANGGPNCNNPTYVQNADGTWTATVSFQGRCNCVWTPTKGKQEVSPLACKDVDASYTSVPNSKNCEEKGILIPDKPYTISKSATAATKDAAMFAAEKACNDAAAQDCTTRCGKVEATEKPTTELACCVPTEEDGTTDEGGDCSSDDALPHPEPIPDAA